MRHRDHNQKVLLKHSTFVKGLIPCLERMSVWPEIMSLTPATITPKGGYKEFRVKVQYETQAGLKCLAVAPDGTQEVFIVTDQKAAVRKRIELMFPPEAEIKPKIRRPKPQPPKVPQAACGKMAWGSCKICALCKRCATHDKLLLRCSICPD